MADVRTDGVVTDLGERFVRAIAAKDAPVLRDLLQPDIDFRAMTPGKFWEASTAPDLVDDIVFGRWFGPNDHIDAVEAIETATVVDRYRVGYRFRVTNDDGPFTVDQQAYFEVKDDRISWLRIMCAGYLADPPLTA
jgi:hypothetical protein